MLDVSVREWSLHVLVLVQVHGDFNYHLIIRLYIVVVYERNPNNLNKKRYKSAQKNSTNIDN